MYIEESACLHISSSPQSRQARLLGSFSVTVPVYSSAIAIVFAIAFVFAIVFAIAGSVSLDGNTFPGTRSPLRDKLSFVLLSLLVSS